MKQKKVKAIKVKTVKVNQEKFKTMAPNDKVPTIQLSSIPLPKHAVSVVTQESEVKKFGSNAIRLDKLDLGEGAQWTSIASITRFEGEKISTTKMSCVILFAIVSRIPIE